MPSTVEENGSVLLSEPEKKSKKNRYSLKKFINHRISPNILRLTRTAKSVDTETDRDSDSCNNFDLNKALMKTGSSTLVHHVGSHDRLDLQFPGSPNPSEVAAISRTESPAAVEHLVEEYEESLTQFADMILESFKSPNPIPDSSKSQDSGSELSVSQQPSQLFSSSPSTTSAPWLTNMLSSRPKGDITPPSSFLNMHRFPPDSSIPRFTSTGIYNEPCDAKSITEDSSNDPAVIYTLSSLQRQRMDVPDHDSIEQFGKSTCSSPRSESSNLVEPDLRSLQIQSQMSSNDPQSGRLVSTKSAEMVVNYSSNGTSSSSASCSVDCTSSHRQYAQKNPGFVDGPRGNSVIMHHPASPFARVPRIIPGAIASETAESLVDPVRKNMEQSSRTTRPGLIKSNSLFSGVPQSLTGNRLMAPRATVEEYSSVTRDSSSKRAAGRLHPSDGHPTYEEAWDLKLARQLGFGMSRLTPMLDKQHQTGASPDATPTSAVVTKPHFPASDVSSKRPITSNVADKVCPKGDASTRHNETSTVTGVNDKLTLKSQENRPAVKKLEKSESTPVRQVQERCETGQNSEYDYAYNGSWSMGVQLNLSLAMNQRNDSPTICTTTNRHPPPSTATITGSPQSIIPPAVPAHQSKRVGLNGHKSENQTSQPAVCAKNCLMTPAEFDNVSTGSFDDSWDRTQGRFLGELTNCQVVDPKAVLSTLEAVSRELPTNSSVPKFSSKLTTQGPSAPASSAITALPTERSQSGVTHQCTTDSLLSYNWTVNAAALLSLPLEEQPWFHPSLTRSEAEELLSNAPEGSFLVRKSETCLKDYSLTIRHKTYLHMKISRNARGQFILGEYSQPYASVPHMIYHYASTSVPVRGAEYVMLIHPVHRQIPCLLRQTTHSPSG